MKIKKIIALIKDSKCLSIFEGKDCQWLSDGYALYPVFKDFEITPELLCDMHDLDVKKTWYSQYAFTNCIQLCRCC